MVVGRTTICGQADGAHAVGAGANVSINPHLEDARLGAVPPADILVVAIGEAR